MKKLALLGSALIYSALSLAAFSAEAKKSASLEDFVREARHSTAKRERDLPTIAHRGSDLQDKVRKYLSAHSGRNVQRTIIVEKSRRKLGLYLDDTLIKEYDVALGQNPIGDKVMEGDSRTPEGEFYVAAKFPHKDYHRALQINYPNKEDAKRGLRNGLITKKQYEAIMRANDQCELPPQNTKLGTVLYIHGGSGPAFGDWTIGCVALENPEIREIYSHFALRGCHPGGTPKTRIIIKP